MQSTYWNCLRINHNKFSLSRFSKWQVSKIYHHWNSVLVSSSPHVYCLVNPRYFTVLTVLEAAKQTHVLIMLRKFFPLIHFQFLSPFQNEIPYAKLLHLVNIQKLNYTILSLSNRVHWNKPRQFPFQPARTLLTPLLLPRGCKFKLQYQYFRVLLLIIYDVLLLRGGTLPKIADCFFPVSNQFTSYRSAHNCISLKKERHKCALKLGLL
jgi:hypothetical protein